MTWIHGKPQLCANLFLVITISDLLLTGQDSISIPSFPIGATSLEVLDVGWMFTSIASPTLPGSTFK